VTSASAVPLTLSAALEPSALTSASSALSTLLAVLRPSAPTATEEDDKTSSPESIEKQVVAMLVRQEIFV